MSCRAGVQTSPESAHDRLGVLAREQAADVSRRDRLRDEVGAMAGRSNGARRDAVGMRAEIAALEVAIERRAPLIDAARLAAGREKSAVEAKLLAAEAGALRGIGEDARRGEAALREVVVAVHGLHRRLARAGSPQALGLLRQFERVVEELTKARSTLERYASEWSVRG
jgi:hypothetical protein